MICRKCKKEIPDNSAYCNLCGISQTPRQRAVKKRGNGEGSVYQRANGSWRAEVRRYADGQHYRATKDFSKKRDAVDYLAELKNAKRPQSSTLEKLHTAWSTSALPKLSASKQTAYRIAHEKFTDIRFRDIKLVTIEDLQEMVDEKGTSYYTKRDMKSLLSHLYKRAVAQQEVTVNLATFIELPTLEEDAPDPFNEDELKLFWADYGAGNMFTGYILLMIYSGMMPGELLKAEIDMVKWDKQTIEGCGIKTRKRKTTPIVVADLVIPVLKDLCAHAAGDRLVQMGKNQFYDAYKDTLKRIGCRPLPPYACRHTTATALALGNIAPSVIQEVMRHTKITTTQRYIHVDEKPMLEAVNTLKLVKAEQKPGGNRDGNAEILVDILEDISGA